MSTSSEVSQNKRGGEEYWNGGLALPEAKRTKSGKLVHDSDIMALLEMIDNMDAINSNPEETHNVIQLQDERLNGVMESVEYEVGLKGQADDVSEKGSGEMGLIKQAEITDGNSEATSDFDTAAMYSEGNLAYCDDLRAELDIFVDHTAVEHGIIMNLFDGNLKANIIYSDAMCGYTETVYGSLWEDDIWQWSEHPVIQSVFASPRPEESGFSGAEFDDAWDDFRIQRLSATVDEGL